MGILSASDEISICALIDLQRALAQSDDAFLRCIGTLWISGAIEKRLSALTDRQVGQICTDYIATRFHIAYPEATLFRHATKRLFRSPDGSLEEVAEERPPCPVCGNEMLLHVGIDERDFWRCVVRACGHKEYITITNGDDTETR